MRFEETSFLTRAFCEVLELSSAVRVCGLERAENHSDSPTRAPLRYNRQPRTVPSRIPGVHE